MRYLGLLLAMSVAMLAVPDATAATAALAIAALALAVHVSAGVAPRQLMVGARALAHAEPLSETPAPSHPTTAGRPLGRAPTGAIAAA
jgi:hypothetical protein